MIGDFYHYWGKARKVNDNQGDDYHLLPYHCLDVAACGYWMVMKNHFAAAEIFRSLGLSQVEAASCFAYYLGLHDIGKFAAGFQGLYKHHNHNLITSRNKSYVERHDSLGYWLWQEHLSKANHLLLSRRLDLQRNLSRINKSWLRCVTGHHGLPPKEQSEKLTLAFDKENIIAAGHYVNALSKLLAIDDYPAVFYQTDFLAGFQQQSWAIAGLSVLADWLGSNATQFHYLSKPIELTDYWHNYALAKAEVALNSLPSPSSVANFQSIQSLFPFIQQPTPLQQHVLEVDISVQGAQLFILEDGLVRVKLKQP